MSETDYNSEPEHGYEVEEEVDERCYFTQIPNLVFELPISREAKYFYIHLKRTAGDSGECYKSLRRLSQETQTSKPTLIKAKAELVKYGLIRVWPAERKDKSDIITIRNIWRSNIDHFDRVVKEKTTPVKEKTTPGKGENRKKNIYRKELSKKGSQEKKVGNPYDLEEYLRSKQ